MMDDKKTNIESTEVKGYRELKRYEEYKQDGNDENRKMNETSSFKKKVMIMMKDNRRHNKYV